MSSSSNSPAPKSNESAKQSPSNADFLYEQSAVSSESNAPAGSSPPSSPPSPLASSPSSQPPPPPKSQSPPPSSPPPPPQSSPPPKPSPPPPPKSSPSPPPSSPPPSPPPSSPPPSPPPSKSPPAPHPPLPSRSPPPKSSSSSPSTPSPPPSPPSSSSSPSGASPPKATPTSPPSENESAAKPPAPSGSEASQSNPAPETPVSPPAAPGTPVPLTPNPNQNPNAATPAVPTPPKEATNSTPKIPVASGRPPNLSSAATNTTAAAGDSSSSGHTGTVVGLTVAGVFFVALVAVVFLFVRRRKKKNQPYPPNYMPPPPGAANKSEGYYPGQGPNSGPAESYYSNGPFPQSSFENSYGSQRERNGGISGGGTDSGLITGTKVHFTYEELMDITNGFSRQNVLGEGGFGCVYKGWMLDGKVVAVKQLKAGSGQGEKEFRAEVEIITRVHHRHLVSLVGYCISEQQRLLIYEYVPNKTLEHHLYGPGMPVLEWTRRLKIALGSAKGLAYLHEDCHPKIIHRDIKSANILLDDSFEAQVADFGLAKLTDDMNTHVSTRVMGTFGYMAPEYASSGKLTDRSDVFSFGVVLLELITGRKPVDPTQPLGDESLVEWARPLLIKALESGDLSELVDPRLEKHYVEGEMLRMVQAAAACVRHSATKRPRMAQVCRSLDCEGELSDLSNGVKFGQSTAYDSGQYNEDIVRFRRMALGSGGSSEFEISSSEFNPASRELSGPQSSWTTARPDVSSDESETRAFNNQGGAGKNQRNNSVRRF